ncbi:hypothetical protein Dfri01_64600 [Dyadobacter frigoris]|uniref:hybrid sensor histidine kinase/response regulator n=1 Tax=Dyadobacter frigoris TaxID=2576211 RepID=UPI0024A50F13|nr:hybrid sensor histidine kinase/response regulator [Dyadobacter frigoris]GLU56999.1 hypothetical protein Dfri01_64600 [Dyadobacter frigoris]
MSDIPNTRVLVIDDEEMVRDNIEEILIPRIYRQENESINLATSILFETAEPLFENRGSNLPIFTVDKAPNGMEGVEMVKKSLSDGPPYAVIFLDMRMPGWDGLETAIQIRKYDSKAEIIFITAFSDRSIDEILEKAGQNVGYHCKPYASEEIIQLATKAVTDYNRLRNLEELIETISLITLSQQQLLAPLLRNILDQLTSYIQSDTAVMGKISNDYQYERMFSIGAFEETVNIAELISKIRDSDNLPQEVIQLQEVVWVKLDSYTIFAVLRKQERLKTEKLYLLKLFVQNAAKAIRNAELQQQLLLKEKLALVGNAVGMVMHDLRSPVKNIQLITGIMRDENMGSEYLDMVDECAGQASEIFDDFLDFINQTPARKQPVNLTALIADAVRIAKSKMENSDVLILIEADNEINVNGDASKLKRSIVNLVSNGIEVLRDFASTEKIITITAKKNPATNYIFLEIRDNGPGIPQDIVSTLFEAFITKNKSNGTGLGLAIVKQYIAAHEGEISVRNENGAVFEISLPG